MKKITSILFIGVFLLSLSSATSQCLTSVNGLFPAATYTPTTCNGIANNVITTVAYAGEYSNVNVESGQTYTFKSSNPTDYITISTDDGATAATFGLTPVTWVSDVTGVIRFYIHLDDLCGEADVSRTRSITCGIPACTLGAITYTKVSNCPDATFNVTADITSLGSASSFSVADNQGGTPQVSGIGLLTFGPYNNGTSVTLTATPDDSADCTITSTAQTQAACPAVNDNFADALPIACGNNYTGTTVGATLDEDSAPDGFGADMDAPNLWYSFTGSGFEETVTLNLCGSSYDCSVLVYTGSSGNLTLVAGNDDDPTCGAAPLNTRSRLNFISDGTTTYFIAVEGYQPTSTGAFTMDVTCAGVTPPAVANQTCGEALALEINNTDYESDNSFGNVSVTQPSCDSFGSVQDVWFSFVAPAEGTVNCTLTNGTMTSGNFNVYSGDCATLTAVTGACNANLTTPTTEVMTGLTAGATYYVQVWSNFAEQGTFNLKLANPSLAVSNFDTSEFSVYPNPVSGILSINFQKNVNAIAVYNMVGQEVLSKTSSNSISQVDMSSLTNGIYMVKVYADNQVNTVKVVKE